MNFTKEEVLKACKDIAPAYDFDPLLIFAVCLQEGATKIDKRYKDPEVFDPSVARLEQGFYRKYSEPFNYATTSEILLAASYGVMQTMGESLREAGYFDWYFNSCEEDIRKVIKSPYSEFAIPNALDAYCVDLGLMIEWGCRWMVIKRTKANGNIKKMLGYWNGDTSGKYASSVLAKYEQVKKEYP